MSVRALVTGGGGFVGQWLARALLARGDAVWLAGLEPPAPGGVLTDEERAAARWLSVDVRRAEDLERALDDSRPDLVFHLAGLSYVPEAQDAPARAWDVNVLGAVRLLAAIAARRRAGGMDPTVLVVGTAMQYGKHDTTELPLTESAEQRPLTVYGSSKAAQETAALQAWRADGVRVICTRSFNHSGPGHAASFLLPALVRRAFDIRRGTERTLRLGADAVRDYLHVKDVIDAYLLLAERGMAGEAYNVASGEGVSARQLAADVLLRVGAAADISTDPALLRSADVPVLVGSYAKLHQATGWTPRRTRGEIIDDLVRSIQS